jgi:cell division protein FtsB
MPAAVRVRSRSSARSLLRKAGLPAAALILMGFFGYYAVLGPNGILSYREYTRQLEKKQAEYAALDKQRAELKNRVALLDPNNTDPDMVDELARKKLNVAHPDEVIVPLR